MKKTPTKVAADGLRYKAKIAGSPFGSLTGSATISCIRCGRHRARSMLESCRVAGRLQMQCRPSCIEIEAPSAKP